MICKERFTNSRQKEVCALIKAFGGMQTCGAQLERKLKIKKFSGKTVLLQ